MGRPGWSSVLLRDCLHMAQAWLWAQTNHPAAGQPYLPGRLQTCGVCSNTCVYGTHCKSNSVTTIQDFSNIKNTVRRINFKVNRGTTPFSVNWCADWLTG